MAKKASSGDGTSKSIYYFGENKTDGRGVPKAILGGKGANLAEMTGIGLPVPPGFTITTEVCHEYYTLGEKMPPTLMDEVKKNIELLEKELGKKFGDDKDPLLVSVRSGAAVSMPGMMDTVLNLGLTDKSVQGLAAATGNERFAWDAFRRLLNMFGDVVMGVDHHQFEIAFDKIKSKYKVKDDTDVPTEGMKELCQAYEQVYKKNTGEPFPQNPLKQLELAIRAVFASWNTPRAVRYREIEGIRGLRGTAVNVQTMVFGNMGSDSGTGVCFTRNNATGENKLHGDFLVNAQGEDVVAGIRESQRIAEMKKWNKAIFQQLEEIKVKLEKHYKDMQDIEFTIERGHLYMLQTRTGKRTGMAAVRIACEMVKEGLIDEKTALLRVPPNDLRQLMLPSLDPDAKKKANVLTKGVNASPGAAVGRLAFTAAEAKERAEAGERVLLVRRETSPEDIDGMWAAQGILTSTGGTTSHAAVVAVGWGKPCIAGAKEITIDAKARKMSIDGKTYSHQDTLTLDGTTGEVIEGEIETVEPKLGGDFAKLMQWADEHRRLRVRTNADTPDDAQRARDFGAEGIGLCRTEHMFFDENRIGAVRQMILVADDYKRLKADIEELELKKTRDDEEQEKLARLKEKFQEPQRLFLGALNQLLPYQREDFEGIFKAMHKLPVTVRLLDPPLHEFLPQDEKSQEELAKQMGVKPKELKALVDQLHEANPMLGHRGCRLSVTYPEILQMQVRAIVEAAINCNQAKIDARPEIMIPLVGTASELQMLRDLTQATIDVVKAEKNFRAKLEIPIGTMIEIPRAALTADQVAEHADFFSFGTNDLTQMTFGFSRDDIGSFLPDYLQKEILHVDPFQSLDVTGVGQLVEMGVAKGRSTKKDLKVGICGEHGGDPASIMFCNQVGLDYVSCSPFRVPVARLAAAQAALSSGKK